MMTSLSSTTPVNFDILPSTASLGSDQSLSIGGVRLLDIAKNYGTPAYVYDESQLRDRCDEAVAAFPGGVAYASKAFLCKAMAQIAFDAGMRIDVASGGEMHIAIEAGVPADRLVFHGNNKSDAELTAAHQLGVGLIVIDSFDEMDHLETIYKRAPSSERFRCLVRVTPGIEAHTHEYIMTGHDDSKFGFGLASGQAEEALKRAAASNAMELVGIHAHIGSQIFEASAFQKEVETLVPLVTKWELSELCIGGGLGVRYVEEERTLTLAQWARAIHEAAERAELPSDVAVTAEPGRAIVATAGVTLYTVGTIKDLPGIRTYVSVDGGMSDNPRPILYGSQYEAFLARTPRAERHRAVTIAGKHCESGDILIRETYVPADIAVGEVLVTPVTGAYGHSMASHYNRAPRPPVIFVRDGQARVVCRRETYDDLTNLEM